MQEHASDRLTELDIRFELDNVRAHIQWFRTMQHPGSGWSIPRHVHSYYELHLVRSGKSRVLLDGRDFQVQEGELYVTAPGVYHQQTGAGDAGYLEYCLCVDMFLESEEATEGAQLLEILHQTPCGPCPDAFGALARFEAALKEAEARRVGYVGLIANAASDIVILAARALSGGMEGRHSSPLKPVRVSGKEYRFALVKSYIEEHIMEPVSPKEISRWMHLSEKQVLRTVKDKTGMSTKAYISAKRLEKAKELLSWTEATVKEVSRAMGFSSEYYFSQFFHRTYGVSPTDFKKKALQDV